MASPYNYRWQKARATFLKRNPLCVFCKEQGKITTATVVDHITPHKGDSSLFWDRDNWQPLCKLHHDSAKKKEEERGSVVGCTVDGLPLDGSHHWYE